MARNYILLPGLLAAFLLAGCARTGGKLTEVGPLAESRPPLVLISIDTLRSDRLPAYGYAAIATPALDRLRDDGVLFEHAYSPMPLTLPAHTSMLSGLLPPQHGVRDNMGYQVDASRVPLLAQRLQSKGYATGAAVSSFVLRQKTGIASGFDFFDDAIELRAGIGPEGLQRDGGATLAAVLPWLRSVADRPFLLFLHLYEPHAPYKPPEPYASLYASAYDGEIAAADSVVGALLEELERLDVYDRAAIIVTSDHGEGLGDHGEEEHGIFVYRESIQVPLLVKLPFGRSAGATVAQPAHLTDIAPTLLALAGDDAPEELAGTSLLALIDGAVPDRKLYAESYYPRLHFGWSALVSLLDDRYQYIESPQPELFDLEADPGQIEDLIEKRRDEVVDFRRALARIDHSLELPSVVDPETRRQLESLGYLGGALSLNAKQLVAPQSQKHLLTLLTKGTRAAAAGRHAEAVEALDAVLKENPNLALAWEQKARSLEQLDRLPEALEDYQKALELSSGSPHLALTVAKLMASSQRFAEARTLARSALEWDPVEANMLLAQLELAVQRPLRALEHAQKAVDAGGADARTLTVLAQVQLHRGRLQEVMALTDRALENVGSTQVQGLQLVRGNALAKLERFAEAESALRREIDGFSRDPRAYAGLSMLLARTGRAPEALPLLRSLVANNPSVPAYAVAIRTLFTIGDREGSQLLLQQAQSQLLEPRQLMQQLGL